MTRKDAAKRAWIRRHLGDSTSDAELLSAFAAAFKIRNEAKAASELKRIIAADQAIEEEFAESSWARHIALGQALMVEMRAANAHGPAAQMWKAISQAKGFEAAQKVEVEVSGPDPSVIRQRIAQLLKDQRINEMAHQVGAIDTNAIETRDPDPLDVGDRFRPAALLARSSQPEQAEPSEPSEPSEEATGARENLLAEAIAGTRAV